MPLDIGQLLACCQAQLQLELGLESRALLIPEQSGEYVTGTLHIDGDNISCADLMIKPSPKSGSKNKVHTGFRGFSNCWKLIQLTDVSNQLKQLMDRFNLLLHRQNLHKLPPYYLAILLSDIIHSLHSCQDIFETPKRPDLRDIHSKQMIFKPTLPEEILLNIFLSSFHLIVTVFYLSTSQHRYHLQNTKPIVSLCQQESLINVVLDGSGGKEYEVIYQGEGSCQVPTLKCMLTTISTALKYCQVLHNKIECFL
ncbi:Protein rogdi-like [Oopsacas minuta]|uniref:Protein rogdi-like n=1 Tax=Oopsacas minuta TaxID=111878 RepID=A0AAV7JIB5_9METZ|nr:Protein rogdi-like [Oopsacas minuta]